MSTNEQNQPSENPNQDVPQQETDQSNETLVPVVNLNEGLSLSSSTESLLNVRGSTYTTIVRTRPDVIYYNCIFCSASQMTIEAVKNHLISFHQLLESGLELPEVPLEDTQGPTAKLTYDLKLSECSSVSEQLAEGDSGAEKVVAAVNLPENINSLEGHDHGHDDIDKACKGKDKDKYSGSDDYDNNDNLAVVPQRRKVLNLKLVSLILERINLKKFQCKFCLNHFASEACFNNHLQCCVNSPAEPMQKNLKTCKNSGATLLNDERQRFRPKENEIESVDYTMDVDHDDATNTGNDNKGHDDNLAVAVPQGENKHFNLRQISVILHRINMNKFQCKYCSKLYASEDMRDNHAKYCICTPAGPSQNKKLRNSSQSTKKPSEKDTRIRFPTNLSLKLHLETDGTTQSPITSRDRTQQCRFCPHELPKSKAAMEIHEILNHFKEYKEEQRKIKPNKNDEESSVSEEQVPRDEDTEESDNE